MKNKKILSLVLVFALGLFLAPQTSQAVSGENIKRTKVKVYTKQGDDWFKSRTIRTTSNGTLVAKNVLPGKYKMTVNDDDKRDTQTLGLKLKMLDNEGRKIKEETDVNLYVYIGNSEVLIGTVETDDDGWLETEGLSLDTVYKLEIDDEEHLSKKDNTYRIKVKAQIDDSDWFYGFYGRTDENKVLEVKDVLPGKYKFKYKSGDADPSQPFTLRAQLRNDKGAEIKEPTKVEVYAYINKARVLVATVMTDADGWVTLPGVMTKMKYRLDVE